MNTESSIKADISTPTEAIRPPKNVVTGSPIFFVRIPATGDIPNVVPSCREPTIAKKKKIFK